MNKFIGEILSPKMMILQRVEHPTSHIGVCYANAPKKGGRSNNPLQGDLLSFRNILKYFMYEWAVNLPLAHRGGENFARGQFH